MYRYYNPNPCGKAVDLWTIRYEEALAMEVIYLRNEIKKLREEISKLK